MILIQQHPFVTVMIVWLLLATLVVWIVSRIPRAAEDDPAMFKDVIPEPPFHNEV